MTLFFLVVGLEAKRQLDLGELRDRRRIAVPVMAALCGIAIPAAIYLAWNAGGPGARGWGAAISTDTAFALGGSRPAGAALGHAYASVPAVAGGRGRPCRAARRGRRIHAARVGRGVGRRPCPVRPAARVALAASCATNAGIGARDRRLVRDVRVGDRSGRLRARGRSGDERLYAFARGGRASGRAHAYVPRTAEPALARAAQRGVVSSISPNERLQYQLHPWTSYVIVPLFALANAGVTSGRRCAGTAFSSPITLGIITGYVVGKPAGVVSGSWLASRPQLHGPRAPVSRPVLLVGGAFAGIGFTVSLLISALPSEASASGGGQDRDALHDRRGAVPPGRHADDPQTAGRASRTPDRRYGGGHPRSLRRCRPGTRSHSRSGERSRDDRRIRGLRVPVLRSGGGHHPRAAGTESGNDVRYVWRHLPLSDVHPNAQLAAEASEAAAAQDMFWEMFELLMSHQGNLQIDDLEQYARQIGLDVDRSWTRSQIVSTWSG